MRWGVVFLILTLAMPALAVQPDEMLADPALEARARNIGQQLRCLVCQGEDIDESSADFAADLRQLVRERITAGDTDAEVLTFVRKRYGDYVLMSPPMESSTYLLWLTPVLVLAGGVLMIFLLFRRGKHTLN